MTDPGKRHASRVAGWTFAEVGDCAGCKKQRVPVAYDEYYTYCLNCLTEVLHDFRTIVAELKERGT